MSFSKRIWTIVLASLISLLIMGALGLYSMRLSMLEERKQQISQLLVFADAQLKYFHEQEKSGKLTRDEAQARAKEALSAMRNGNDYFHVRSYTDNTLLVHPMTDRLGKVDTGGKLEDGRDLVVLYKEELAKGRDGMGFVWGAALRPDKNDNVMYPKLSGVERFEPWDWLIGIGFFVDDINGFFWKHASIFIIVAGALIAALSWLVLSMRNTILQQLGGDPQSAVDSMRKIANGELGIEIPLEKEDSTSLMASLKVMQQKLKNISSSIQENADSLNEQVNVFDETAKNYLETKSEEQFADLLRAIKKMGRTVNILGKSVARIKL